MKSHCGTAINLKSEGERNNQSVSACLREAASAKAGNPKKNW